MAVRRRRHALICRESLEAIQVGSCCVSADRDRLAGRRPRVRRHLAPQPPAHSSSSKYKLDIGKSVRSVGWPARSTISATLLATQRSLAFPAANRRAMLVKATIAAAATDGGTLTPQSASAAGTAS